MLENQFLLSMPSLNKAATNNIVIYLCEHNKNGAVGLIVNCPTEYRLKFIFDQLAIPSNEACMSKKHVLFGGPVEQERGFVLHRPIKGFKENLGLDNNVCISTSKEILKKLAVGQAPKDSLVTLGYSGWGANQLEEEIMANLWLTCDVSEKILYDVPYKDKWQAAVDSLGFDVSNLVTMVGNA